MLSYLQSASIVLAGLLLTGFVIWIINRFCGRISASTITTSLDGNSASWEQSMRSLSRSYFLAFGEATQRHPRT
jgi:hypothetical protein